MQKIWVLLKGSANLAHLGICGGDDGVALLEGSWELVLNFMTKAGGWGV